MQTDITLSSFRVRSLLYNDEVDIAIMKIGMKKNVSLVKGVPPTAGVYK